MVIFIFFTNFSESVQKTLFFLSFAPKIPPGKAPAG